MMSANPVLIYTVALGDKKKIKFRLLPFSLITTVTRALLAY